MEIVLPLTTKASEKISWKNLDFLDWSLSLFVIKNWLEIVVFLTISQILDLAIKVNLDWSFQNH